MKKSQCTCTLHKAENRTIVLDKSPCYISKPIRLILVSILLTAHNIWPSDTTCRLFWLLPIDFPFHLEVEFAPSYKPATGHIIIELNLINMQWLRECFFSITNEYRIFINKSWTFTLLELSLIFILVHYG